MAITPVLIHELPPGITLSVDIYANNSDIKLVTGRSLLQQANRSDVYGCDIAEAYAGHYVARVYNDSAEVAVRHCVNLADTTTEQYFRCGGTVACELASDGLDQISVAEPIGRPTTFPGWVMWLIQRFRSAKKTATTIEVKSEAGAVITTQAITKTGDDETLGKPL